MATFGISASDRADSVVSGQTQAQEMQDLQNAVLIMRQGMDQLSMEVTKLREECISTVDSLGFLMESVAKATVSGLQSLEQRMRQDFASKRKDVGVLSASTFPPARSVVASAGTLTPSGASLTTQENTVKDSGLRHLEAEVVSSPSMSSLTTALATGPPSCRRGSFTAQADAVMAKLNAVISAEQEQSLKQALTETRVGAVSAPRVQADVGHELKDDRLQEELALRLEALAAQMRADVQNNGGRAPQEAARSSSPMRLRRSSAPRETNVMGSANRISPASGEQSGSWSARTTVGTTFASRKSLQAQRPYLPTRPTPSDNLMPILNKLATNVQEVLRQISPPPSREIKRHSSGCDSQRTSPPKASTQKTSSQGHRRSMSQVVTAPRPQPRTTVETPLVRNNGTWTTSATRVDSASSVGVIHRHPSPAREPSSSASAPVQPAPAQYSVGRFTSAPQPVVAAVPLKVPAVATGPAVSGGTQPGPNRIMSYTYPGPPFDTVFLNKLPTWSTDRHESPNLAKVREATSPIRSAARVMSRG
eukprot:TRINITY_DN29165_c0_g1_i3.p1 TRINITY_DN29165_c0_g1~~TRINITY_DN29165_c0_g1_i3.p1  ORF type:complete len:535 (-),score=75.49 TRINITY_DN29165_c0_g1_i3:436-2040(-)